MARPNPIVAVGDNVIGGADANGSGLTGLADRIAAMQGEFTLESSEDGTTLQASIPTSV